MAALHSALQSLGPTSFDEVPSSTTELRTYIQDLLAKSRLIIESVPPPPSSTSTQENSKVRPRATSASEVCNSSARVALPPQSLKHDSLQKEWGKQLNKTNGSASKKEKAQNPLDIPVYKLAGKDGKGAWFGRRSVHEGLGFEKWKRRLEGEFEETLRIRREKEEIEGESLPGGGNIRGIGGEKRVERIAVPKTDDGAEESTTEPGTNGDTLGTMQVYHLSAQFPGPTAPRDFVTLLITSDMALDETESTEGNVEKSQSPPRSYMIISKPCDHSDTQPREGYIRGQYESVEFIREVPVDKNKDKARFTNKSESNIIPNTLQEDEELVTGRRRGKTVAGAQPSLGGEGELYEPQYSNPREDMGGVDDGDADTNPVEWIMITRSDPGGSVPRWMVERGTPGSIVGDAVKFLDWACQDETHGDDESKDLDSAQDDQQMIDQEKGSPELATNGNIQHPGPGSEEINREPHPEPDPGEEHSKSTYDDEDDSTQYNGLMASVSGMVNSYAPQVMRDYLPGQSSGTQGSGSPPPSTRSKTQQEDLDDGASVSSAGTFESAASHAGSSGLKEPQPSRRRSSSNPAFPVSSALSASEARKGSSPASTGHTSKTHIPDPSKPAPTSQERELAKLACRKREAEAKLAATRAEHESIPANPDASSQASKETQNQPQTSDRPESNRSNSSNKVEQQQQRKRASTLNRTESKLVSQIDKLETQQVKLNSKIEARQRKQAARDDKARGKREIESLTKEVENLRNEVNDLRGERAGWVDLVGRLQRENTKLVADAAGGRLGSGRSSPGKAASQSAGSAGSN